MKISDEFASFSVGLFDPNGSGGHDLSVFASVFSLISEVLLFYSYYHRECKSSAFPLMCAHPSCKVVLFQE